MILQSRASMAQRTSQAQTRIAVGDSTPIVIDVEAALDEVYSALANERRRATLAVLTEKSIPLDLETLAREVAAKEHYDERQSPSSGDIRHVKTTLYHSHLPKLDHLDLIEFDADQKTVEDVAEMVSTVPV